MEFKLQKLHITLESEVKLQITDYVISITSITNYTQLLTLFPN